MLLWQHVILCMKILGCLSEYIYQVWALCVQLYVTYTSLFSLLDNICDFLLYFCSKNDLVRSKNNLFLFIETYTEPHNAILYITPGLANGIPKVINA